MPDPRAVSNEPAAAAPRLSSGSSSEALARPPLVAQLLGQRDRGGDGAGALHAVVLSSGAGGAGACRVIVGGTSSPVSFGTQKCRYKFERPRPSAPLVPTETARAPHKWLPSTMVPTSSTRATDSGRVGQVAPPDPRKTTNARPTSCSRWRTTCSGRSTLPSVLSDQRRAALSHVHRAPPSTGG